MPKFGFERNAFDDNSYARLLRTLEWIMNNLDSDNITYINTSQTNIFGAGDLLKIESNLIKVYNENPALGFAGLMMQIGYSTSANIPVFDIWDDAGNKVLEFDSVRHFNLSRSNISASTFTNGLLSNSTFNDGHIDNSTLTNCTIAGLAVSAAQITNSTLTNSFISNSTFVDGHISGTTLTDTIHRYNVNEKTITGSLSSTDSGLIHASGTITLTLPSVIANKGLWYEITNKSAGVVTLDGNTTDLIYDAATFDLYEAESINLIASSSAWFVG